MKITRRILGALILAVTISHGAFSQPVNPGFPADFEDLKAPIPFDSLVELMAWADTKDHITVTEAGKSGEGRPLFLVHLNRGGESAPWRVLFIGAQHGDEAAGRDALTYMIRSIAQNPKSLPRNVDLWIMPNVNPDGAVADRRTNSLRADMNRDHRLLEQVEVQTIHDVARRLQPHVSVDCHEFARDSRDYKDKGWDEWPIIMMDTAANPIYGRANYEAGMRWIEGAHPAMKKKGINYVRYNLGGPPPHEEQRYSTLEPDDARNGLAMYGGLSFIIESGVKRADPNGDLPRRIEAYHVLLDRFLTHSEDFRRDIRMIAESRKAPLPEFIATNYFWGTATDVRTVEYPVIDTATQKELIIRTGNFHQDRIIKDVVAAPRAYVIAAQHAELYGALLTRHGIPFEVLDAEKEIVAEQCTLDAVEPAEDPIYNRFSGRQIVSREDAKPHTFAAGSLVVRLDPPYARRAVLAIEPCLLYGLYKDAAYFETVDKETKVIPVYRVMEGK